jgi:hypothetical protein
MKPHFELALIELVTKLYSNELTGHFNLSKKKRKKVTGHFICFAEWGAELQNNLRLSFGLIFHICFTCHDKEI